MVASGLAGAGAGAAGAGARDAGIIIVASGLAGAAAGAGLAAAASGLETRGAGLPVPGAGARLGSTSICVASLPAGAAAGAGLAATAGGFDAGLAAAGALLAAAGGASGAALAGSGEALPGSGAALRGAARGGADAAGLERRVPSSGQTRTSSSHSVLHFGHVCNGASLASGLCSLVTAAKCRGCQENVCSRGLLPVGLEGIEQRFTAGRSGSRGPLRRMSGLAPLVFAGRGRRGERPQLEGEGLRLLPGGDEPHLRGVAVEFESTA